MAIKEVVLGKLSDWIDEEDMQAFIEGDATVLFFIENGELKCEVDYYDTP